MPQPTPTSSPVRWPAAKLTRQRFDLGYPLLFPFHCNSNLRASQVRGQAFSLARGKGARVVGKMSKSRNFRVDTPAADLPVG